MLLFKDKPINKLVNDAQQKHAYCNGIDNMHYLKIKAGWPIGVFFAEEIHNTNLNKKRKPSELFGGLLNII